MVVSRFTFSFASFCRVSNRNLAYSSRVVPIFGPPPIAINFMMLSGEFFFSYLWSCVIFSFPVLDFHCQNVSISEQGELHIYTLRRSFISSSMIWMGAELVQIQPVERKRSDTNFHTVCNDSTHTRWFLFKCQRYLNTFNYLY